MDPLADTLSAMKNAEFSGSMEVTVRPTSKLIGDVLRVMREDGYIGSFEYVENGRGGEYTVELIGRINDCSAVKPRFESRRDEFEKWEKRFLPARNFGILIVTTSSGVMDHEDAKEQGVGGQLLAYVY